LTDNIPMARASGLLRRGVCPAGSAYLDQGLSSRKGKMVSEVRFTQYIDIIIYFD